MSLRVSNKDIQRRYVISSSFKMAALFTVLLSVSICSWLYVVISSNAYTIDKHFISIIVAILSTTFVVVISYLISFFVVRKINQITNTAVSIVNTQDLGRRIKTTTNWDDLSNLAGVLNLLLDNVEELMLNVKNVSDSIAHDLRTPLARLRNNLHSLDNKYQTVETENALKDCDVLLEIFSSLLKLNRLEHGKQKLNKTKVSIKKLVNDAVSMYEPFAEEKSIKIALNITDKNISLDKNLMFQSFVNVIDNAIKFSQENSDISINGYLKSNCYIVKIIDSGCGIAEENAEKIFNKLFREDKNRSGSGNGLGLALVKQVVELHNGRVLAKPNAKGLTISFEIPIH